MLLLVRLPHRLLALRRRGQGHLGQLLLLGPPWDRALLHQLLVRLVRLVLLHLPLLGQAVRWAVRVLRALECPNLLCRCPCLARPCPCLCLQQLLLQTTIAAAQPRQRAASSLALLALARRTCARCRRLHRHQHRHRAQMTRRLQLQLQLRQVQLQHLPPLHLLLLLPRR